MKTLTTRVRNCTVLALAVPVFAAAQNHRVEPVLKEQVRVRASLSPAKPRVVVRWSGRGYLGVQLVNITEELREFYGAPADAGVLVSRVVEDSPAAAAGFEVGDVILRIGGEAVDHARELARAVARLDPEESVGIEVIRSGAPLTLTATLAERERGAWFAGDFDLPDLEGLQVLEAELPRALAAGEEAREAMQRAFEEARERMSEFDFSALAERLAEAEDRLRELERKLEAKKER